MAYNIRPLSFVEVLDSSFQVYRDNFILLAGIAAVAFVPEALLIAIFRSGHRGMLIIGFLLTLLLTPIMLIAATTAIASVYLDRPVTIVDAYRSAGNIFTPVVGTILLKDVLGLLGLIALVVPGIYLIVAWSLVLPVTVIEHRFGVTALRRSRQLVTGEWWDTLGIILVAALLSWVPAWVLDTFWHFIPVVGPILTAMTESIATAYGYVVIVIYYFDRRCRLEDFDLRLLADQVRMEGMAGAAPQVRPSSAN
ncbi:MAG: hypothetical protein IVW56_07135 [Candidatus Binataceae bacterium]|nr:hypothetical protein [Candidatus Binataceae bacterium]